MPEIAENIAEVKARIERAARKAGRDPAAVKLIAVSKTVGVEQAGLAIAAGVIDLGESRVQEARSKFETIGANARWHMIGPLQSNKAKYCPGLFTLIHSVDRLELMRELSKKAEAAGGVLSILLQVNVSGEPQKSGCAPEEAEGLLKAGSGLTGVIIEGLMTIPPFAADPEDSRQYYKELAGMKTGLEKLGIERVCLNELSMGMTGDFEVAVEEGATYVRVGSGIFGERI